MRLLKKSAFLVAAVLCATASIAAQRMAALEAPGVTVVFSPLSAPAARDVAGLYPKVKADLRHVIGWDLPLHTTVLLTKERTLFRRVGESPLAVAFAVPRRNLIVMDLSRIQKRPFGLENTLKHETCHLLLHRHIRDDHLPRWLDEGICQWVSDGVGDIPEQKRSLLNRAAYRGHFLPFSALATHFPAGNDALVLAYEESKGFVGYLAAKYGNEALLNVLSRLKRGDSVQAAFSACMPVPLGELEKRWQDSLRKKMTWFTYFAYYLYEILFAVTGIICMLGFVKVLLKKRAYRDEEEE